MHPAKSVLDYSLNKHLDISIYPKLKGGSDVEQKYDTHIVPDLHQDDEQIFPKMRGGARKKKRPTNKYYVKSRAKMVTNDNDRGSLDRVR